MRFYKNVNHRTRLTDSFGKDGYHLVRSVLDRAILQEAKDAIVTARDRVHRTLEEWVGQSIANDAALADHQARLKEYQEAGLPNDLRHYLTGEFDLQTRLDPRICRILSSVKVRSFLAHFLEIPQFYVHYPPMIRFRVVDATGSSLPPHQDFAYNRHLTDFVTVWVPLVDIDSQLGGLVLYEGSHLDGFLEHGPCGLWAHGVRSVPGIYRKHRVQMEFGDALLFPPFLLHESAPHMSDETRYSIDFRVFTAPENTRKSYFDPYSNRVVRVE
jgi:ectoine hydroxylase-related dioxygenase (phytanoyl-CoA dioxygenase family)